MKSLVVLVTEDGLIPFWQQESLSQRLICIYKFQRVRWSLRQPASEYMRLGNQTSFPQQWRPLPLSHGRLIICFPFLHHLIFTKLILASSLMVDRSQDGPPIEKMHFHPPFSSLLKNKANGSALANAGG